MQQKVKPEPKGQCFICGRSAGVLVKQNERTFSSLYPVSQILTAPVMDIIRIVLKEANVTVPALEKTLPPIVQKIILTMPPLFVCEACIEQIAFCLRTQPRPQQAALSDSGAEDARLKDTVPPHHPDYCEEPLTPAEAKAFRDFMRGTPRPKRGY